MVEPLALEIGQVEFIRDQAVGHVARQPRMTADRGELAGAAALVRDPILLTDTEREKVDRVLKELSLSRSPDIVVIDARPDNKPSASKAT